MLDNNKISKNISNLISFRERIENTKIYGIYLFLIQSNNGGANLLIQERKNPNNIFKDYNLKLYHNF